MKHDDVLKKLGILQELLISRATGGRADDQTYISLRRELMADPLTKGRLPEFVRRCGNLEHFWAFIKPKFGSYAERRRFIWDEFRPLVVLLEEGLHGPASDAVAAGISILEAEHVDQYWRRALERRSDDPEGAVTLAKTLMESVCKLLLEEMDVPYDPKADLPALYHSAASQLHLAPDQHAEKAFKAILGSCQAVVGGLAAIRNIRSDSHGVGRVRYKPEERHAELAVNLAGAMALFLVRTWKERGDNRA